MIQTVDNAAFPTIAVTVNGLKQLFDALTNGEPAAWAIIGVAVVLGVGLTLWKKNR